MNTTILIVVKLIEIYQKRQSNKQSSKSKDQKPLPKLAFVIPYNLRVLRGEVPIFEKEIRPAICEETVYETLEEGMVIYFQQYVFKVSFLNTWKL